MKDKLERIQQWWRNAPPKTKRNFLFSLLVLGAGIVLLFTSLLSSPRHTKKRSSKPEVEILSRKAKEELVESSAVRRLRDKVFQMEKDVQDLKASVAKLQHGLDELNKRLESYTAEVTQIKFDTRQQREALAEALQKIRQETATVNKKRKTQASKKGNGMKGFASLWGRPAPVLGTPPSSTLKKWKSKPSRIRGLRSRTAASLVEEVSRESEQKEKKSSPSRTLTIHIPAGSYFRGILMNGVDAPVSVVAKKNPYPVLIKVKTEAWLPNEYRYDIKGCYIVAAAWGDMSAERAYFRTERLSCIFKSGGVIETALDASVIDGQDGKLGVFGRLVTKNGSLIARSLLAGIASGLSKVLSPRQTLPVVNLGEGNQDKLFVAPPVGQSLEYGIYSGVGKAAERIADYYLKMAEQTFPVIELKAGTPVEVFLLRGLTLTLKNRESRLGGRS